MASSLNQIRSSKFVGQGVERKIVLGFEPKAVTLHNVTDRISYEKTALMADAKAVKRDGAGTGTYVDSITINSDGFTVEAAEAVADKEFHYVAFQARNDG